MAYTQRREFISIERSYHGNSIGARFSPRINVDSAL